MVKWEAPKIALNCVQHYLVTINAEVNESLTATTNSTNYTFSNLNACTDYDISVTPVDINNENTTFISNRTKFEKGDF